MHRNSESVAAISSAFRRNCEIGLDESNSLPSAPPPLPRLGCAVDRIAASGKAKATPSVTAQTRPSETSISNRIRLVMVTGSRIGAVDLQADRSDQRSVHAFSRKPEDHDTVTHYNKLILIPAVMIAAALLLPALAFAQVQPAPATAPPAVALPAIPPAQKVPEAKTPLPAPAEAVPAPIVPPPLAKPSAVAAAPTAIPLTLPRDLSPWGMFLAADIVVKAVMIGLALASLLTWTVWFAKAFELLAARCQLRRAIEALNEARSLGDAKTRLNNQDGDVAMLLRAAETELRLSGDTISAEGVKERIASRLERIEAAAGRRMTRGTGILATVGATAPFVGLFGTVWGIMNSFIGISKQHTTNLAVVAPGIAEALLATALGLVAAIPAVVMYNMFSRWTAGYRAQQADVAAEILRLASRDLDRGALNRPSADRRRPIAAVE